jgi:hypothetical protein
MVLTSYLFNVLMALWLWRDARLRRAQKPLFGAFLAVWLGVPWIAFYLADRPLAAGETREQGFGWAMALAFRRSVTPLALLLCIYLTIRWSDSRLFASGGAAATALFAAGVAGVAWFLVVAVARALGAPSRRADLERGEPHVRRGLPFGAAATIATAAAAAFLVIYRLQTGRVPY